MVQPDDEIAIHLKLTAESQHWQGNFTLLRDSGELLTAGHIVLGGSE
jgi:hypothetical protein